MGERAGPITLQPLVQAESPVLLPTDVFSSLVEEFAVGKQEHGWVALASEAQVWVVAMTTGVLEIEEEGERIVVV